MVATSRPISGSCRRCRSVSASTRAGRFRRPVHCYLWDAPEVARQRDESLRRPFADGTKSMVRMTPGSAARPSGIQAHGLDGLTGELGLLFGGDYNPEQWP